jgi:hypothetical protein
VIEGFFLSVQTMQKENSFSDESHPDDGEIDEFIVRDIKGGE